MSVVEPATQFPSDWIQTPCSIGVIRDGAWLRFWFQPQKGKGTHLVCSLEEWQEDGSKTKAEFLREIEQGAMVVAGLSPDRGLIRECVSPLDNLEKSAEIWPSLLDSALPFPLEECEVAFLPPVLSEQGGATCIAAAARKKDIEFAKSEWAELDIVPDLLIPEVLLLSDPPVSRVWVGESRCIYTAWSEGHFLGAGGNLGSPLKTKAFSRFKTVWKQEHPDLEWQEIGPGEPDPAHKELMEKNAASALFRKSSCFINLLAESEGGIIQKKLKAKRRSLMVLAGVLILLLISGPLMVRGILQRTQRVLQDKIEIEFIGLTGEESPARGQEVLLATRYAEEQLQEVMDAQVEVSGAHVSTRMIRVLKALRSANLIVTSLEADPSSVSVDVLGDEKDVRGLESKFTFYGDEVSVSPTNQGEWRLEVRKP